MFIQNRKASKTIIWVIALLTPLQVLPGTHAYCLCSGKCESTADSRLDGHNAEKCICHSPRITATVCKQNKGVVCDDSTGFDSHCEPFPFQCPPDCICHRQLQFAVAPTVEKDTANELHAKRAIITSVPAALRPSCYRPRSILSCGGRSSSPLALCSMLCRFTT